MRHAAEHINPEEFIERFRYDAGKCLIIHDDGHADPIAVSVQKLPESSILSSR